jgi:decaprenylphospho-beta-D-erythro-pentofuranosid-2-ulose 2-reductase
MAIILVIGATSAIAEQCARLWAARGDALFLVGRNAVVLDTIAADVRLRGAERVGRHALDLTALELHEAMMEAAVAFFGTFDTALIAHGVLPDQAQCEQSVPETIDALTVNALSTVSLMTLIANRLEAQRSGTLAVISSVAGDRGRASNYVYGSAKAMVTAFASGLRQRLHAAGVAVVTIKPGFVDTPMTASLEKSILWVKPGVIAQAIVRQIDRRQAVIYVPWYWRVVMAGIRAIPETLFQQTRL